MPVSQRAFLEAVLDPARPAPSGLTDPAGGPAGRRFDVYRNTVVAGLSKALAEGYPAVRALLGADNFSLLARAYVRAHPPESPLMMHFGERLPGFLGTFEPVRNLAFLPDLARLEYAIRESYHAADAKPVDPAALVAVAPERLDRLRLSLAPAVRLVRSEWPVASLHGFALGGGDRPEVAPETALVCRPGFDPTVVALGPADAVFVAALADGTPLGAAVDAAAAVDPAFDPSRPLGQLIAGGAIAALQDDEETVP